MSERKPITLRTYPMRSTHEGGRAEPFAREAGNAARSYDVETMIGIGYDPVGSSPSVEQSPPPLNREPVSRTGPALPPQEAARLVAQTRKRIAKLIEQQDIGRALHKTWGDLLENLIRPVLESGNRDQMIEVAYQLEGARANLMHAAHLISHGPKK